MTTNEKNKVFERYTEIARLWCVEKKAGNEALAKQADDFGKILTDLLPEERLKFDKIKTKVFREYQMAEFFQARKG